MSPAPSRATRCSIRSAYGEEHGDALNFTFSGTVTGDTMSGALDMGEYLAPGGRQSEENEE